MTKARNSGFSLIEILIVVVVLGILAAIVVPQFSSSGETARHAATTEYLQAIRQQIDLYRNQHMGKLPGLAGADPDLVFVEQMTLPTNVAGDRSTNADQGFGDPDFPLGPYIPNVLSPNPFNKSRRVRTVTTFPATAPGGSSLSDPGWIYEITSGRLKINKIGVAPTGENYWDL
jgi:prepilin-type N-terminal cleavage/methylation domain-containing protein